MNLDDIDKSLHDLGMLSAITEARRDYLRESKTNLGVMRFNTRYVSNVTVGYCMKRATHKHRLCPYVLPVRHRTKSENSEIAVTDTGDGVSDKRSVLDASTSRDQVESSKSFAKRCQSLENLNISVEAPSQDASPDMDCVSTRIQKLQVDE